MNAKKKLSVSVFDIVKMYQADMKGGTRNAVYNNTALLTLAKAIVNLGYGDTMVSVEQASNASKVLNRGAVVEALTNLLLDCYENDNQESGLFKEYGKAQAGQEDLNTENHSPETLDEFGLPQENLEIKYITGCTKGAEINPRNKDTHVLALIADTAKTYGGYYLLNKADLVLDEKTKKVKYESAYSKGALYLARLSEYAGFDASAFSSK